MHPLFHTQLPENIFQYFLHRFLKMTITDLQAAYVYLITHLLVSGTIGAIYKLHHNIYFFTAKSTFTCEHNREIIRAKVKE